MKKWRVTKMKHRIKKLINPFHTGEDFLFVELEANRWVEIKNNPSNLCTGSIKRFKDEEQEQQVFNLRVTTAELNRNAHEDMGFIKECPNKCPNNCNKH
jgi:hypothetical protein